MKKIMITTLAAATLSVFALTAQAGGYGPSGTASVYQTSGSNSAYTNNSGFNSGVGSYIQGGGQVDSGLSSAGGDTYSRSSNLVIGGAAGTATTSYSGPGNATATTAGFSGDYQTSSLKTRGDGATGYATAAAGQDYNVGANVNFSSSHTDWGNSWKTNNSGLVANFGGNDWDGHH